jgi:hypothetical protein
VFFFFFCFFFCFDAYLEGQARDLAAVASFRRGSILPPTVPASVVVMGLRGERAILQQALKTLHAQEFSFVWDEEATPAVARAEALDVVLVAPRGEQDSELIDSKAQFCLWLAADAPPGSAVHIPTVQDLAPMLSLL